MRQKKKLPFLIIDVASADEFGCNATKSFLPKESTVANTCVSFSSVFTVVDYKTCAFIGLYWLQYLFILFRQHDFK